MIANALLIQAWIPFDQYFFSYNSVSWNISVEIFFYLIFPLIILNKDRWLKQALVVSLLAVAVFVAISYYTDLFTWDPAQNNISSTGLLYVNPLARSFEFILGMVACTVFLKSSILPDRSAKWTIIEVAVIVIFLLAFHYFLFFFGTIIHWIAIAMGKTDVPFTAMIYDINTIEKKRYSVLAITACKSVRSSDERLLPNDDSKCACASAHFFMPALNPFPYTQLSESFAVLS
ncbi:MAG: hypothetical protein V4568_11345 [Pseudomonadota bacterium]